MQRRINCRKERSFKAEKVTVLRTLSQISLEKTLKKPRRNIRPLRWVIIIYRKIIAEIYNKKIKQYQEKWLQHIQRMETNRIPKQALQYKLKGRRHIGRPRKRWRDQFLFEDTRNRNQT